MVDLGCGPGPLTRSLAERWPDARVVGLDSSDEMVQKARSAQHAPNLEFELADASSWMPDPDTDVLVSNAMLQWIPGHQELMAKWLGALKPECMVCRSSAGQFFFALPCVDARACRLRKVGPEIGWCLAA